MHPYLHARTNPDKPAIVIAATGETMTYRQLDERSNQGAHLLRSLGLKRGDVIAVCMENHPRYLEISWAKQRSGLYLVCISSKATAAEVAVHRRGLRREALHHVARTWPSSRNSWHRDCRDDCCSWPAMLSRRIGLGSASATRCRRRRSPTRAPARTCCIRPARPAGRRASSRRCRPSAIDAPNVLVQLASKFYALRPDSIYLSPAPLYHAAPLRWCMTVNFVGGTVVLMERFDPERALALIERYKITHAQWVPTHFVRMLRLPPEVRARYDVSSMKVALHAAAPCRDPGEGADDRMVGTGGLRVLRRHRRQRHDSDHCRRVAGAQGLGGPRDQRRDPDLRRGRASRCRRSPRARCTSPAAAQFEYHNAPQKTREARNRYGWSTLGDVGYVDRDGYLFLTDRKAFMIISGGVNIYPQEIENVLIAHPRVMDVAVFGAPDDEMGEKVVAVMQPVDFAAAGPALADELLQFASEHLSHVKVPRLIEFTRELPRHPNGKLYKRLLRDEYWRRSG